MKRSLRTAAPAVIVALGLGLLAGFFMPRDDDFFALKKNFTIFGKLYEELATGYVDDLDSEQLMRTGIDAMLQTLDPYTVFIDEADNEDIEILTRGRYGGVGLTVGQRGGKTVVLQPVEGASAFEQGVRTGDVITNIAGIPTDDLESDEIRDLLRGDPGTTVEIRVEREGEPEPLDFRLTRSEVQLKNVTYAEYVGNPADGVGYVKLERFSRDAAEEVAAAIQKLYSEGPLNALVLDLRGNPGGLLEAAVDISGHFLPQGSVIVSTRGRQPESERVYRSRAAPVALDVPLAVLVDGGSASASEIVAGAIQDHDRGIVVGERTFGKGLVQIIRGLPYHTSLKMTTAKYYTPSGRCIQAVEYSRDEVGGRAVEVADSLRRAYTTVGGRPVYDGKGIEPDIEASLGEMSELEAALVRQAAFFLFANRYAATHEAEGDAFSVSDADLRAFHDWLATQDFTYRTRAEQALDGLAENLDGAGYDETADEIEELRRELWEEKELDFERHAPRLKERLRREILARYLGESAQIEASFRDDYQFNRARELLADASSYRGVLSAE
ncbi:MAG: S41 family peptidase [Rhodothermales bacterium]